jgi:hypothetical protein
MPKRMPYDATTAGHPLSCKLPLRKDAGSLLFYRCSFHAVIVEVFKVLKGGMQSGNWLSIIGCSLAFVPLLENDDLGCITQIWFERPNATYRRLIPGRFRYQT